MNRPSCNGNQRSRPRTNRGFTLIEVLVTLVVVSVGLISIAQLQARSLQFSHASLQRTVAVVQANDLVERLWTGFCDTRTSPDVIFPNVIFDDWVQFHTTTEPQPVFPQAWTADLTNTDGVFRLEIDWQDPRARDETNPSFIYFFRLIDPNLSNDTC